MIITLRHQVTGAEMRVTEDNVDFWLARRFVIFDDHGVVNPEPVPRPRRNASRAAWAEYAALVGAYVTDDMTRDDIRAIFGA